MGKKLRWNDAQKEESVSWERMRAITESPRSEIFQDWSDWLRDTNLPSIDETDIVLDIGCGPQGIIQMMPSGVRIGLDPLIFKYKSMYPLLGDINYIVGVGEYLPFKDSKIDFIFMVNAFDHVIDPKKAIVEVKRVCKKFLILDTNTTPLSDKLLMKLGYRHPLSIYHPHSFTAGEIIRLINSHGFKILEARYSGSNTRLTFLLHPIFSIFKRWTKKEQKDFWYREGKLHLIIKQYFLNIVNFFLFRITKENFADNLKLYSSKDGAKEHAK